MLRLSLPVVLVVLLGLVSGPCDGCKKKPGSSLGVATVWLGADGGASPQR